MTERKPAKKGTPKSASAGAVNKTLEGFTDEERAAMKERAHERKAAAGNWLQVYEVRYRYT